MNLRNKSFFIVTCTFLLSVFSSCGGAKDLETSGGLKIVLDDTVARSKEALDQVVVLATGGVTKSQFGVYTLTAPASTAAINCFMANITGAGVPPDPSFTADCTISPGSFGLVTPAVVRGQPMRASVPAGNGRKIDVYGIYPDLRECGSTSNAQSGGYLLGSATTNISDDTTVTIPVAYVGGGANITCDRSGGSFEQFGTGADGDLSVTGANVTDFSTVSIGGGRFAGVNRKVNNIAVDGRTLTLATAATAPYLTSGDEVLVAVMAASATSDCVTSGNELYAGFYKFARVSSTDGAFQVVLSESLVSNPALINNAQITQTVYAANFCHVQLVRVPNFQNVTIGDSPVRSISAPAYSAGSGVGGVLAMRVNGALTVVSGTTPTITMSGYGFGGGATGASGYQAAGLTSGGVQSATANGIAGGGGAGGAGGGGAHTSNGGAGGAGGTPGASGVGYTPCTGSSGCFFMGGGGGGAGSPGGAGGPGGGMIYLSVRNLNTSAGTSIEVSANGSAGANGTNGAGGGGGGHAFVNIQNQIGAGLVYIWAIGGNGGDGGTADGGGGAGGDVVINYCSAVAVPVATVTGGAAGVGAGADGAAGSAGGPQVNQSSSVCSY